MTKSKEQSTSRLTMSDVSSFKQMFRTTSTWGYPRHLIFPPHLYKLIQKNLPEFFQNMPPGLEVSLVTPMERVGDSHSPQYHTKKQ